VEERKELMLSGAMLVVSILQSLLLISQSVQLIANARSSRGISLPDLNSTFDKGADTTFRGIPGVTDTVYIIAAAAAQLMAALPLLIKCRILVEGYVAFHCPDVPITP